MVNIDSYTVGKRMRALQKSPGQDYCCRDRIRKTFWILSRQEIGHICPKRCRDRARWHTAILSRQDYGLFHPITSRDRTRRHPRILSWRKSKRRLPACRIMITGSEAERVGFRSRRIFLRLERKPRAQRSDLQQRPTAASDSCFRQRRPITTSDNIA